jgi:hypothetical protein
VLAHKLGPEDIRVEVGEGVVGEAIKQAIIDADEI